MGRIVLQEGIQMSQHMARAFICLVVPLSF